MKDERIKIEFRSFCVFANGVENVVKHTNIIIFPIVSQL